MLPTVLENVIIEYIAKPRYLSELDNVIDKFRNENTAPFFFFQFALMARGTCTGEYEMFLQHAYYLLEQWRCFKYYDPRE